ncbi:RimJ/RimL family protein N-acetyltransferase [Inhella inkyongensis]|uniref:RimJ/RimL family protein N-acetyltransferase n=1 Tax=Inhella inkyongensis TaxID=392593 RepID=A0A840S9X3_9BURK|nr:GNAT family protein [Inhella inkyongensis]MBB5205584.1 RimJ/RimL family protein N-acetyltransferase [Inhella inkyongensis]
MLTTPDLRLRHTRPDELDAVIEQMNDLERRGPYLPSQLASPQQLRKDFADNGWCTEASERLLIVDAQDQVLGMVRHFKSTPYYDAREIGYSLFAAEQRGRGLTTRAVRLLVDYVFNALPLNRLEIRANVANTASMRVAEKLGFRQEGVARGAVFVRGAYVDMAVYALLRQEWVSGRQGH